MRLPPLLDLPQQQTTSAITADRSAVQIAPQSRAAFRDEIPRQTGYTLQS